MEENSQAPRSALGVVSTYHYNIVNTGIPEYDDGIQGLKPKELVVISSPNERLTAGLVATIGASLVHQRLDIAYGAFKGGPPAEVQVRAAQVAEVAPRFLHPDRTKFLLERLRQQKTYDRTLAAILLDDISFAGNRRKALCKKLKRFAKNCDLMIVLGFTTPSSWKKRRPTLRDFGGTAEVVDLIFHVEPPESDGLFSPPAQGTLVKSRCGPHTQGPQTVPMSWRAEYELRAR